MVRGSSNGAEISAYLAIAFGITWGLAAAFLAFPDWMEAQFGPIGPTSPLFYIAVWAPNVAAVAVTLARGGWSAVRDLFSRLLRWKVALWAWLAAIFFYPALMVVVQFASLGVGEPMAGADAWSAMAVGLTSISALLLGPVGEEVGWRGFLLPRVLERTNAVMASLIVGAIWMIWHIPAFLISGVPQSNLAFPAFMLSGVALSVFVTWIFVNARQSVLVAGIVTHGVVNAYHTAMGGITWVHASVLMTAAIVLVLVTGSRLTSKRDAQTNP